jgi:two-component system cell cycle response regulator DivK
MKTLILVVEDNERNRKLVRTILEFRGYEVLECEDGEPSVTLARERRPALILMDIELPKLDGISALKLLRADPATATIPVVAVTASVTPGERERVVAAGFNAYIAKPIDMPLFIETVERLAGRAQAVP